MSQSIFTFFFLCVLNLIYPSSLRAENTSAFRVRLSEDLGTLDWNYGEVNSEVIYQLMEGLFRGNEKGFPKPAAAQSYKWNSDKTELAIFLRKDRYWSDGKPLCAQHFVDSFLRLKSKTFASPYAHYADLLKSSAAENCQKMVLKFNRSSSEALALLTHFVFFPIRLDILQKFPRMFNEGTSMIVNGPFKVKDWSKNSILRLVPNTYYRGNRSSLSEIEFRFIPDDSTAKAMFDLKKLDWLKDVPQILRGSDLENSSEFRIFPTLIVYYFGLNAGKSALLKDPSIRRLLSAALDRSELPKLLGKECRGTTSWLVPDVFPNLKAPAPYMIDEIAKQKLLLAVKEKRMNLVLRTYSKSYQKSLVEWAQGQWEKKLGVRIPIEVQEGKVYWREVTVNPAPIFSSGVTAPYGHPRAFLKEFFSGGSANWTGWASEEYDKATEAEDFAKAEEILENSGFVIPLFQKNSVALVSSKWTGFHINPLEQVFLETVRKKH